MEEYTTSVSSLFESKIVEIWKSNVKVKPATKRRLSKSPVEKKVSDNPTPPKKTKYSQPNGGAKEGAKATTGATEPLAEQKLSTTQTNTGKKTHRKKSKTTGSGRTPQGENETPASSEIQNGSHAKKKTTKQKKQNSTPRVSSKTCKNSKTQQSLTHGVANTERTATEPRHSQEDNCNLPPVVTATEEENNHSENGKESSDTDDGSSDDNNGEQSEMEVDSEEDEDEDEDADDHVNQIKSL
jgi:hypothetical protein